MKLIQGKDTCSEVERKEIYVNEISVFECLFSICKHTEAMRTQLND